MCAASFDRLTLGETARREGGAHDDDGKDGQSGQTELHQGAPAARQRLHRERGRAVGESHPWGRIGVRHLTVGSGHGQRLGDPRGLPRDRHRDGVLGGRAVGGGILSCRPRRSRRSRGHPRSASRVVRARVVRAVAAGRSGGVAAAAVVVARLGRAGGTRRSRSSRSACEQRTVTTVVVASLGRAGARGRSPPWSSPASDVRVARGRSPPWSSPASTCGSTWASGCRWGVIAARDDLCR